MLVRLRAVLPGLALLSALSGCESGSVDAGDVLVVAHVEISPPDVALVAGDSRQLQATAKTSSGIAVPNRPVSWSSDDLGLASVSNTGMVTAIASGSTRINATVDGVRASVVVEISPKPVATVTVLPGQVPLLVGESADLIATPRDVDGVPLTGRAVSFASDNPLIATVSGDGHVVAVAPGLTVVRATVEGKTGTANIAVNARPAAQLDFQNEPATGSAGAALVPLRIEVQNDQGGTYTIGPVPVTIALGDNPTGAVLAGTRTVNALNGVATFNDLTVNQAGTGYTLVATSGSLASAESAPFAIVAGSASTLSITTQPAATGSSGTILSRQPVIQIRDVAGNAVAKSGVQVTVALEGAGATLGGIKTVATNANGVATFTNLSLSGSAGTYTLLFAAPSLTAIASDGITLGAGAAATLSIVEQPAATAQSGVPLTRQPVLQLQDAEGNPVAQAGLAVSATIQSGGGSLGGTSTVTTDGSGRATFTTLSIGGPAGTRTLRFGAAAVPAVISASIVVGPGPASAIVITTNPPPATTTGAVLTPAPVVRLVDAFGNPVDPEPEVTITASVAGGSATLGGTTSTTTVTGIAAFPNLVLTGTSGSNTLSFSASGLTSALSSPVSIGAGSPTSIAIVTQPSASAETGVAFAQQPVVQVRDGANNAAPVGGIPITVTIASGDGTLLGTTTRSTNGSGQAAFNDLAISGTAGPRTLRFTGAGLTGVTSSAITITVTAPPATSLEISTAPSTAARSGQPLAAQPVLKLQDGSGTGVAGATVTATINSGPAGSSLTNATAVTDAAGLATFSGLTITGGPGDYTIRFAAAGLTAVSAAITIGLDASRLQIATAPSSTANNGVPFPAQPVVQVADANGNAVPVAGTTINAVIASGPSGATLAGASAVTGAAGTATFSGLAITGPIGSYTIRFQSGALTPATSGTITLAAGAPAVLTITTEPPTTAENDVELTANVVVRVQDASGNNVPGVGVTASVASGAGIVKGTLVQTTSSNGRATFNDLALVGTAGPWTLGFTSGGSTVVSRSISLLAGDREVLAIQVQPSTTARSGSNFSVQPKIELRDTGGNLVAQDKVRVNAVLETVSGIGSLGGGTSVETNNSGVANFSSLRINGTGTFRIRFTSSGMTSVSSVTINVTLF